MTTQAMEVGTELHKQVLDDKPRTSGWACPEPGIYPNILDHVYHAWPACSKHWLDMIGEFSPLHVWYHRQHPKPPTDAMVRGSAVHVAGLQPDRFDSLYMQGATCEATVKSSGLRCKNDATCRKGGQWLCGVHAKSVNAPAEAADKIILSPSDWILCSNVRDALYRDDAVRELMQAQGDNELSVVWDHPLFGLRCKSRFDGLRPSWGAIFDLKTCQCASKDAVEHAITDYGYHRQAAFYLDAAKAAGLEGITEFGFIFLEINPPYAVASYRMENIWVEAGREQLKPMLEAYAKAEQSGYWGGYDSQFADIGGTKYEMRKIMQIGV